MKLHLLHGPAIKTSRIKLLQLRSEFSPDSVVVFDRGEDLQTILTNLQAISLFEQERLVILENPPEDFSSDLSVGSSNLSLILWFDHQVLEKKPVVALVKKNKGSILFFEEERGISVFPFLDFLAHGDIKAFLELQKLKNANFDIQYLITMVFYLLRNLVVTPKNAPPFVKQKLERQRKNFNLEKIKSFYQYILEIDLKIKSGLLETAHAEFLLVNKFILVD